MAAIKATIMAARQTGAFAGPAEAWPVAGIGLYGVFVGNAAAGAWAQRRTGAWLPTTPSTR
jgi:hypothetical protein